MANGCDNIFMERARCHKIFDEITVLGGWNTAENTNGVVIAVLSIASYYQDWKEYPVLRKEADTFLLRALIADWLCQANVLQDFVSDYAPAHQINPYFLEEHTDEATDYFITNLRQLVLDKLDNRLKEQPVFLENRRKDRQLTTAAGSFFIKNSFSLDQFKMLRISSAVCTAIFLYPSSVK